jgi:hypothetical protein
MEDYCNGTWIENVYGQDGDHVHFTEPRHSFQEKVNDMVTSG